MPSSGRCGGSSAVLDKALEMCITTTVQVLTEWSVGMQGLACRVSSQARTAARPAIKP